MNIILFGFKGCGKTYFGKKLAAAMYRPFIDTDQLLVKDWMERGNRESTTAEIYRKTGEAAFRKIESRIIASLADVRNSVIAVGGGSVLDKDNRILLQKIGRLAFLDVSLETILNRNIETALGSLESLYAIRSPLYRSIPAAQIPASSLNEEEVISALAQLVQTRIP